MSQIQSCDLDSSQTREFLLLRRIFDSFVNGSTRREWVEVVFDVVAPAGQLLVTSRQVNE